MNAISRIKWAGLKMVSLAGKSLLLLAITASVIWVPITNYIVELSCIEAAQCNSPLENFLLIWGIPALACAIGMAFWAGARRASLMAQDLTAEAD